MSYQPEQKPAEIVKILVLLEWFPGTLKCDLLQEKTQNH